MGSSWFGVGIRLPPAVSNYIWPKRKIRGVCPRFAHRRSAASTTCSEVPMTDHSSLSESGDDGELVPVCPECDSTGVRETVRDTTDHDYYCRDCGARPIEPEMRERKRKPGLRGLAGRLDAMDPDDVADGDDRLVTDGGVPHDDLADVIATWTADAARCQLERHAKDRLSLEAINEAVERIESCAETVVTQQLATASLADGHDHEIVTDGGLDQDIEEIGVEAGEGESWAEAAGRLRDRDDDRWHYCICGARYRSRAAALRCCGDQFDDLDDGGAGEIVADGGDSVVYYATGNYDVYHERRDCRYLRRADSVRELLVSTMNGTREPCGGCVDTVDGSDSEGRLVADGGSVDWPPQFERTDAERRSPNRNYEVSLHDAIEDLDAEMDRLGVDDWRLSTAMDHQSRNPNYPYASQPEPDAPSVVLRWSMDGEQFAIACDAYSRVRDNLRTIGLYVREKRKMEGRPVTTGKSEFANARLPSGDEETVVAAPPPHEVLDVSPDAPEGVVEAAYREKTKTMHPDHGGRTEAFQRLKRAKEAMLDGQ